MRQYVISNDAAQIRELHAAGRSTDDICKALADKVSPAAVKAWLAGTPDIAAKPPASSEKKPTAKADPSPKK